MSQDPYSDQSSQPQNFYQYETMPNPQQASQGPYTTPPPYGYDEYYQQQQQQQSYSSAPPQATPLPLEQAIKELPSQYRTVLTNPSVDTFAQEMGKASWKIVWVQLIGYTVLSFILAYILSLIFPSIIDPSAIAPIPIQLINWVLILFSASLGILSFFVVSGIRYLLAKTFRGQGTFLAQGYTDLLFTIPLGIIGIIAIRVPFLSIQAMVWLLSIYGFILSIFSVKAVHRLTGGKATGVALLSILGNILVLQFILFPILILILRLIHYPWP